MILSSYKSYIIYSNISHCILDDFGVAQPLWLQLFQVAIFRSRIKTRRRCTARFWTPTTRHLEGKNLSDPLGATESPWMTWLCHRRMASNCWLVNWNIYAIDAIDAIDAIGIFWACGAGVQLAADVFGSMAQAPKFISDGVRDLISRQAVTQAAIVTWCSNVIIFFSLLWVSSKISQPPS